MADYDRLADELLEIAHMTFRREILNELQGTQRYLGAMIAKATDIAKRADGQPDPADKLLVDFSNPEIEDVRGLAQAIRTGTINVRSHTQLHQILTDFVEAKLSITNPSFLEARKMHP